MERNFSVGQANELVKDGTIYDLHNCNDFGGIAIASARRVQLWFTPNLEHGKDLASITLDVEGVDFLELSSGVAIGIVQGLDEIGYKNPGDTDLDWLIGEGQATEADHLVFGFDSGEYIRVHGQRIQLRVRCDSSSRLLV